MGDGSGAAEFAAFTRAVGDVVGAPAGVLHAMRRPVEIQVVGRAGVGRSTLVSALERSGFANVVEAPAVDVPGRTDPELGPDVVVYVFTGALRTPDVRVLAKARRRSTVAVLAKADAFGSREVAARASNAAAAETGVRTVPLSAGRDLAVVVDAVGAAVQVVRARRVREMLDVLAVTAAQDVGGAIRDGIEAFLRSDPAVFAASESAAVLGADDRGADEEDSEGDRRRRAVVERRARTSRAVAAGTSR
ncbi:hypothetical protein [Rhodococcus sp. (in: high G+C Gram-positive bacteria)]|uniref:hypothetical protein n=1 Tax=Rhodococcus sp. TaxID=1831 RepID=UPI003B8A918E